MSWLIHEIKAFQSPDMIMVGLELDCHLFFTKNPSLSSVSKVQDQCFISITRFKNNLFANIWLSELCNEFGIADWFHLSTHFNLIGWSVILMAIICLMIVIMLNFRQLLILRIHCILMLPKITKNNAGRKAYALFIFYLCHCQWSGKAATIAS